MTEHIIRNNKGVSINWSKNNKNEDFCLLYNDNNGKYTFTPTENLNCQLYMFGGGGAGGYFFGGGGGAGAAYINKNYTFEKNKTYTFEIGAGGKCDINNINLLFTPGIQLKVFNNTNPTLNNFSFIGEDYSNINIDNNSVRNYIVQDLTIDPALFTKNTTYIWEGYIKGNTDKNYNFSIVSNLKTFVWIQDFENENMTSLNVFTNKSNNNDALLVGGYSFNHHPFSKQMKSNIFYKIKIIAYNDNETINNFNIKIDSNCEIFSFNKENENYKYIKSSDTILTYSNDDGTFGSIKCIGGGNGGCGLYNQDNSYLNGGCGGGSGLNKVNGLSKIQPIYNGFDGAIGTYCGGGGGIMSAGNNANGGDGLILNWFNDTLIFGAGGNASGNNTIRNLGYGCGGNGGTCCYYSKTLVNNNGNNGCILIYIKPEKITTIENFTNISDTINKSFSYIPPDSNNIVNKFIKEALNLQNMNTTTRADYFTKNEFAIKSLARPNSAAIGVANFKNIDFELFIYDVIVISKLYTTFYNVIKHHFEVTLNNDLNNCKEFMDTLTISVNGTADGKTTLTGRNGATPGVITLANNIFKITSLQLSVNLTAAKKDLYEIDNSKVNTTTMETPLFHKNDNDYKIGIIEKLQTHAILGVLHLNSANTFTPYTAVSTGASAASDTDVTPHTISLVINTTAINEASITTITDVTTSSGGTTINPNSASSTMNIPILPSANSPFNKDNLSMAYNACKTILTTSNDYKIQRIFLYLEVFNKVLNTDFKALLPTLKYYMYYYNVLVYNVAIQYEYFYLQNKRIAGVTLATAGYSVTAGTNQTVYELNDNIDILNKNLNHIIQTKFNVPSDNIKLKGDTINIINNINAVKATFNENQTKLNSAINKYNNYLTMYNNILYYYKIIIIFAIFLTIAIILIFSSSLIDNNSKISIYVIIAIFIIIIILLYNNTITIENFAIAYNKAATSDLATLTGTLNISGYNETVTKFISFLALNVNNVDGRLFANDINEYMRSLTLDKKRKAEFYKIKTTTLENNIEIMKKSINYYYYLIVFIASLVIILMLGLILYLTFPQLLLQIVVLCIILLIIVVYYFTYKMHKTTRIYENKNYWANYNPSKNTLDNM